MVVVCPLRSRVDDSSGSAATSGLRSEHLRQLLVLEAALQEFVLRQLPVIVLVHLREYVLRSLLRAVRRPIARTRAEHVVYRLGTEGQTNFVSPRAIQAHVGSIESPSRISNTSLHFGTSGTKSSFLH